MTLLPPPRAPDPDGHYARLGIDPAATQPQIAKAFRTRARILHPDVPRTGNAEAFLRLKQAYDVLSDPERRAAYDRRAEQPEPEASDDEPIEIHPARPTPAPPPLDIPISPRLPQVSGIPVVVWAGMSAVLAIGLIQMAAHLLSPQKAAETALRPNAPAVAPLSATAQRSVLYGPSPVHLAGTANFYVTPAPAPAVLWQRNPGQTQMLRLGELPPFSTGHAIRMERQTGLVEVVVNDSLNGFIAVSKITPGDSRAARQAYCGYNAGPAPQDGELLEKRATGTSTLTIDNSAPQPAVVKLRDAAGSVTVSVFLAPGGHKDVTGVAAGTYQPEVAVGELWSRACNGFAASVRTGQLAAMQLAGTARIIVAADAEGAAWHPIPEQDFERE